MNDEAKQYCQHCPKCGAYYIDVIGETCRCALPKSEGTDGGDFLTGLKDGEVTL